MNLLEIDESISDIQRALGFKVQSVSFYNKTLVLKLWHNHVSYNLILSVLWGQQGIFLIPTDQHKSKFKNEKKPIQLFTESHFKDSVLLDVSRDEVVGRKVDLEFSTAESKNSNPLNSSDESKPLRISICLIPSVMNISVFSLEKSVHLQKPKELPQMQEMDINILKSRGLEVLKKPWTDIIPETSKDKSKPKLEPKSARQNEITKKTKALAKVQKDLDAKTKTDFLDFAKLLGSDPEAAQLKYPEFYDNKINRHKLMDLYFEKYKIQVAKKNRVEERIAILQEEIQILKNLTDDEWLKRQSQKVLKTPSFKTEVRTRKFQINQDLVAYLGKSAQDNLTLLRSAKAWHLWFHVKDLPSAHMIVFKDKSRVLKELEIQDALKWFISEIKSNTKGLNHASLDILVAECRYVKPIKGDKLGRVTYSHEKVVRIHPLKFS